MKTSHLLRLGSLAVVCISMLFGCVVSNPDVLKRKQYNLNTLVQMSMDEQMLLNVVRLKYRDTSVFLKINAINTSYSMEIGTSAEASIQNRNPGHSLGLGAGALYTETPTISFAPLQGEEFTQRLLSPVSLDSLLLLARSGWSIERLLKLAVQSVNGVKNAPSASGPTPSYTPIFEDFSEAVKALRSLQKHRLLQLGITHEGNAVLQILPSETKTKISKRLKELLHLDENTDVFSIESGLGYGDPQSIRLEARSMMGILFFLSQAVEVPPEHRQAGLVTQTLDLDGKEFDWAQLTDPLFRVHWSRKEPKNAQVAVPYRGVWFYIADDDLDSKSSFTLLSQLFALQSGNIKDAAPVLTIPVL